MIRPATLATLVGALGALVACGSSPGGGNQNPDATNNPDGNNHRDGSVDAAPLGSGVVAIPLTSLDQVAYLGPVNIGGQSFSVIVDTGSTTLGIAASTCSGCDVTPEYTPGAGAVDQHKTVSSTYGDGSKWTGEVYSDMVQLGGAADVSLDFASIGSNTGGFFRSFTGSGAASYQGIIGMGPVAAALAGTTAYSVAAFPSSTTAEFAFHNCPDEGTMWMNGVDPSAMASTPATTALQPMLTLLGKSITNPYWSVGVGEMALGSANTSIGATADFGPTVIDTGTTISLIPAGPLATLTAAIQASPGYQQVFGTQLLNGSADMGCVTTALTGEQIDAALPPLHVSFPDATGANSQFVDLPATKAYLLFEGASGTGNTNLWCYAMQDSKALTFNLFKMSLFGESLLNSWIAVFDTGNMQMQFALQKGCHEADAVTAPHHAPFVAGIPWWQQDPRVRLPDQAEVQRKLAPLLSQ